MKAAEIVIEAGALVPSVLPVDIDESVSFVNRSGRVVHVDLLGRVGQHHVLQVPGRIEAVFHWPGRHLHVVHFDSAPRGELRGTIEVREQAMPPDRPPDCSGISLDEICLEP